MDIEKRLSISSSKVFPALYISGFAGLLIIGLFSLLPFSQAAFNSLWANTLFLLFIALLFITAFVQDIFTARSRTDIIIDVFIFPISLAWLVLFKYVGGAVKLCVLLYILVIVGVVGVRHALQLRRNEVRSIKIKQIIAISILFIGVIGVNESYVDETYVAWSLIPAAIITCAVCLTAYLLLREQWATILPTKAKRIGTPIAVTLLTLLMALCCSFTAIATVNSVFDSSDPAPAEYVVLGKSSPDIFDSGVEYTVTVEIDGQKQQIKVPTTAFFNIDKGDTIIVNYYNGALGFPYWKYREKSEDNK